MEALQKYHWPGNVRELQNYVERAVVLAPGDEITLDLLPDCVVGRKGPTFYRHAADMETLIARLVEEGIRSSGSEEGNLYAKIVNRVEREVIAQVMADCDNVQVKAAAKLGINRNTLHKKVEEYGLEK